MKVDETKDVYVVWHNSDRTEGRGRQIPKNVCQVEATAIRLAKGCDVQGSNGSIAYTEIYRVGANWYGPIALERPSVGDKSVQKEIDDKTEATKAYDETVARLTGMINDSDLQILIGGRPE